MSGGQFVSYAQHGEDVILWRALGPRTDVFYVDVGAFHPIHDSVTRALYERGWRGINIEPQAGRIAAFQEDRPEDVNLAVALGDSDGTAQLTVPDIPGWASVLEPAVTGADPTGSAVIEVPLRRLATVLAEQAVDHVDVLKVNVEGAEPAVVRGMLAGPVRPTVCVIEGVAPGLGRSAGDEAVALLVEAGYTHCLFDGLNHYLTIDDRLVDALSVPANPLDKYVPDLVERLMRERGHHIASLAALATENVELRNAAGSGGPEVTGDAPVEHPGDEHDVAGLPGAAPPGPTAPAEAQIDRESRRARRRTTFKRLLREGGVTPLPPPAIGVTQLGSRLERLAPSEAVAVLYRIILGRTPDPEGLAGWVSRIELGMPVLAVAQEFVRSEEAGLQPDPHRLRVNADLHAWSSAVALGELGAGDGPSHFYTPGSVGREILVRALYEVSLQRQPSRAELDSQVRLLGEGTSRETMIRGFAVLPEARARMLGRRGRGVRGALRAWRDRRTHVSTFRAHVDAAEERRIAHLQLHSSLIEVLRLSTSRTDGEDRA